jgi:hypothetical protein
MNRIFSSSTATRILRIAALVGVVGFGVDAGAAAATAFLSKPAAASEMKIDASGKPCRQIVVETDEGYGVRGTVTRTVCGGAA